MRPRRSVCGPRQSPECATTKTAQSSHRPTAYGLSCRVIGRDVETAMLACLCQQARHRGARCLRGRVVPTAKNQPARNLYDRHRFHQIAEAASGETTWLLDLDSRMVSFPQWFKIITEIAA